MRSIGERAKRAWPRLGCGIVCAFVLAGCVVVRPHQREHLAQPAMADPVWPDLHRADDHVFDVREGTQGATGEGGGGCGCN
jgi:hypothetical protein